jgi:YHS domain-containing protein
MDKPDDHHGDDVACHMCRKEVPRSTARSAEGRDYNYFFCSSGCEQRWSANQRVDREREPH